MNSLNYQRDNHSVIPITVDHQTYYLNRVITYNELKEEDIAYRLVRDETLSGLVQVQLADGAVIMDHKDAIFNMIVWRIYHAFDMPITTDRIFERPHISSSAIANIETRILYDIRSQYPNCRSKINDALFKFINYLYNFVSSELNAHCASLSILSLAKLMNHEKVTAITKLTYKKALGTDVVEKKITAANKELQKLLRDRTRLSADENILLYYQETNQINPHQLPQMMIAYGPRTDVDDTIVLCPVTGNAINGLKCIKEVAVESLSAKKSSFYNHIAVSGSQYFGRKQHLLTSSILRIYPGDCGSTTFINFNVTKDNYQNLLGMYTADPTTGALYELTMDNIENHVGYNVPLRNPITCKYTDGVCHTCGGTLLMNIDENINYGILAAIHLIAPTTQKILSAKHLVKTVSLMYEVSKEASKYFIRINADEIHWKPEVYRKLGGMSMGVSLKDMGTLHDISVLNPENTNREERFSTLHQIILRDDATGKTETLNMQQNDICPFFTIDMLLHIRNQIRNGIDMGEAILWIPLAGTEQFSIFRTLVVNDNMLKFVKSVSSFLASKIATYASAENALQDFCDLVYSKVTLSHLTHISTIVKAYLVTNETDYRIPQVTDPHRVIFKTTPQIISNRTIGGQLAFESLAAFVASPESYILRKPDSIFDPLFNI